MDSSVHGPGDYSLTPIRGPQPRSGQRGNGRGFDLAGSEPEQTRTKSKSKRPSEPANGEELSVGQPDHDEAGRRIDVTA